VLAELGPAATPTEAKRNVATTMRLVASELGNTPAICRTAYVHPIVVARYLDDGDTIQLSARYRQAADQYAHSAEERALIRFLDAHFPERRTRARALPRA
jgi:DNA topoisomerase-1